jgi:hypothetical protein
MIGVTLAENQSEPRKNIKELLNIEDSSSENSDIHKLVTELTTDTNLEGKTDLNANQIVAFAKAAWYAKQYDSKAMDIIIIKLSKYLQSKERKGRNELVQAIVGMFKFELEKAKSAEQVKI